MYEAEKGRNVCRTELKSTFIKSYFHHQQLQLCPLPADASFRKYERILAGNRSFILMDSPPQYYDLKPFINMAIFLLEHQFSAPAIYHVDQVNGFLLLEDFGDISIAKYLSALDHQSLLPRTQLYQQIMDLLTCLQSINPPEDLRSYSNEVLLKELEIFTDWYIPFLKNKNCEAILKEEFLSIWRQLLTSQPDIKVCTVLGDYHVENIMLLKRDGINALGLLDFQDAIIGSPLYDVVSILEDARIAIAPDFACSLLDYYLKQNLHLNREEAYHAYHLYGAQRNSRILGVFARKALRDNHNGYIKYLPRVLACLRNDLSYGSLLPLRIWMEKNI